MNVSDNKFWALISLCIIMPKAIRLKEMCIENKMYTWFCSTKFVPNIFLQDKQFTIYTPGRCRKAAVLHMSVRFKEIWSTLTNFGETVQHKLSWKSLKRSSSYFIRTAWLKHFNRLSEGIRTHIKHKIKKSKSVHKSHLFSRQSMIGPIILDRFTLNLARFTSHFISS
jgi:predicted nucleotidyltransferase